MKEKLTANEIRNIDVGEYIVIKLHKDEIWYSGEGTVSSVKEYDSGEFRIEINNNGYISSLKIPSDARNAYRFSGAEKGSNNLKVDSVYKK